MQQEIGRQNVSPRTKKRFGQHFLINKGVVVKILDALEEGPDDQFLEIGPGAGALTQPLNQRGLPLTLVEADGDMVAHLSAMDFDPPVRIFGVDALAFDVGKAMEGPVKVVSNLPYNVSVPITIHLLRWTDRIPLMVLMYQKEVAQRVRAKPRTKDYGIVSVLVQCFYTCDRHFDVGPGSFRPPPKVMSQVIRLRRKEEPLISACDLDLLGDLLKLLFKQRRKMVGSIIKKKQFRGMSGKSLIALMEREGLDSKARPEEISPQGYAGWLARIKEANDRN